MYYHFYFPACRFVFRGRWSSGERNVADAVYGSLRNGAVSVQRRTPERRKRRLRFRKQSPKLMFSAARSFITKLALQLCRCLESGDRAKNVERVEDFEKSEEFNPVSGY